MSLFFVFWQLYKPLVIKKKEPKWFLSFIGSFLLKIMSSGFIDYIVQIDHYLLMVSHPSCRKSKSPIMFKTKPSADVKCYEKGIWRMVNRIIHSKHQDCFTSWKRPPDIFITFFGPLKEVLKALFKGIHNITKDILKTFLRRFFVFGWLYLLGVKNFLKQKHPRGSGILIGKITWANWS